MTDRELLKLTAKAAGIVLAFEPFIHGGPDGSAFTQEGLFFNPLNDDGDALRLAVKLRLEFEWWKNGISANHASTPVMPIEHVGDDPCAATRRAIVRAAAELGKNMHA